MACRNTKSPTLLPVTWTLPKTDFDGRKNYFDAFLLKKPQEKITNRCIAIG